MESNDIVVSFSRRCPLPVNLTNGSCVVDKKDDMSVPTDLSLNNKDPSEYVNGDFNKILFDGLNEIKTHNLTDNFHLVIQPSKLNTKRVGTAVSEGPDDSKDELVPRVSKDLKYEFFGDSCYISNLIGRVSSKDVETESTEKLLPVSSSFSYETKRISISSFDSEFSDTRNSLKFPQKRSVYDLELYSLGLRLSEKHRIAKMVSEVSALASNLRALGKANDAVGFTRPIIKMNVNYHIYTLFFDLYVNYVRELKKKKCSRKSREDIEKMKGRRCSESDFLLGIKRDIWSDRKNDYLYGSPVNNNAVVDQNSEIDSDLLDILYKDPYSKNLLIGFLMIHKLVSMLFDVNCIVDLTESDNYEDINSSSNFVCDKGIVDPNRSSAPPKKNWLNSANSINSTENDNETCRECNSQSYIQLMENCIQSETYSNENYTSLRFVMKKIFKKHTSGFHVGNRLESIKNSMNNFIKSPNFFTSIIRSRDNLNVENYSLSFDGGQKETVSKDECLKESCQLSNVEFPECYPSIDDTDIYLLCMLLVFVFESYIYEADAENFVAPIAADLVNGTKRFIKCQCSECMCFEPYTVEKNDRGLSENELNETCSVIKSRYTTDGQWLKNHEKNYNNRFRGRYSIQEFYIKKGENDIKTNGTSDTNSERIVSESANESRQGSVGGCSVPTIFTTDSLHTNEVSKYAILTNTFGKRIGRGEIPTFSSKGKSRKLDCCQESQKLTPYHCKRKKLLQDESQLQFHTTNMVLDDRNNTDSMIQKSINKIIDLRLLETLLYSKLSASRCFSSIMCGMRCGSTLDHVKENRDIFQFYLSDGACCSDDNCFSSSLTTTPLSFGFVSSKKEDKQNMHKYGTSACKLVQHADLFAFVTEFFKIQQDYAEGCICLIYQLFGSLDLKLHFMKYIYFVILVLSLSEPFQLAGPEEKAAGILWMFARNQYRSLILTLFRLRYNKDMPHESFSETLVSELFKYKDVLPVGPIIDKFVTECFCTADMTST